MAVDAHANFAYGTVLTAPSPATSGTSLVLQSGQGTLFPTAPFNIVIWPAGVAPLASNAEIARCTAKSTDTLTITRAQEGTSARAVVVGDQVAAAITKKTLTDIEASLGTAGPKIPQGRLTLTSGQPGTTADVSAVTDLFYTPFNGNRINLYTASVWTELVFTEYTLALGTVTSGLPYDIFAYNNSGVLALEKVAWASGTTRSTGLTYQDGLPTKSGDATRLYLGTIVPTSTTQMESSKTKRFVWNRFNQIQMPLLKQLSTATYAYTLTTVREAEGGTANRVECVIGEQISTLELVAHHHVSNSAGGGLVLGTAIGEDSTTTPVAEGIGNIGASLTATMHLNNFVFLHKIPVIGKHFYSLLEWSTATGVTTWYGAAVGGTGHPSGLTGLVMG